MPTFRRKPSTITAERFHADKAHDPKGVCRGGPSCETRDSLSNTAPHLHTMHTGQSVFLKDGDWIVPEPDGIHYYPIKADVFNATYEQIAGPFRCPRCGAEQENELKKCPTCRRRLCDHCITTFCEFTEGDDN